MRLPMMFFALLLPATAYAQALPVAGALCSEAAGVRITATSVSMPASKGECRVEAVGVLQNGWLRYSLSCRAPGQADWIETGDISPTAPWLAVFEDGHEYPLQRCD